jgi:hypothetical protein
LSLAARLVIVASSLLVAGTARAQVRWDLGAEVGAAQHLFTDRASGAPTPLPGPMFEIHDDVALIPMVRLGAHVAFGLTPFDGLPLERSFFVGPTVKVAPPLLPSPWRTWVELGLEYGNVHEDGHAALTPGLPAAPGALGEMINLPVGVALAYRANRTWEPFVELGARFALAYAGPLFAPPTCTCASPFLGRDAVALTLMLGLNSNQ